METIVKIKWDKPKMKEWLCDANIKTALQAYCKNTKFEVIDLDELTASEALFGFCAWLTTRKPITKMSSKNDAAIIADLINKFCKKHNLSDPRNGWENNLKFRKLN